MKGTAYLNLQQKDFDNALDGYKKVVSLNPNDAEAWYSAGVVDWMMAYAEITKVKSALKSKSDFSLILSPACGTVRTHRLSSVEDGITMLTKAIALRPDYDDAMAYMNLLYRLRADLQCGDKAAHAADLKNADKWTDLAMAACKKNAEKAKEN